MGIKFNARKNSTSTPNTTQVIERGLFIQTKTKKLYTNDGSKVVEIKLIGAGVPQGGILMYDGLFSDIPSGFALCNGANGTPNLNDRFVYGTSNHSKINNSGGTKAHTSQNHSHDFNHNHNVSETDVEPNHSHGGFKIKKNNTELNQTTGDFGASLTVHDVHISKSYMTQSGKHNHTINAFSANQRTSSYGSTDADGNLPTYYKLAFIMKI